jgi:hypothetical protein
VDEEDVELSVLERLKNKVRGWMKPSEPSGTDTHFRAARMFNRGFSPDQADDVERLAEQYGLEASRIATGGQVPQPEEDEQRRFPHLYAAGMKR